MISNFLIVFISKEFSKEFYSVNITFLHLRVVLILFLLTVTFFSFQNQLYFLRVLLKILKTFSCNLFCDIKYVCLLCDQIPKLLTLNNRMEYVHLFLLFKNYLDYFRIHLINNSRSVSMI